MQTIQQEFVLHAFNCERTFLTPFRNCIFHYRGIKAILKNREHRKSSVFFFFFFFFMFCFLLFFFLGAAGGKGNKAIYFREQVPRPGKVSVLKRISFGSKEITQDVNILDYTRLGFIKSLSI